MNQGGDSLASCAGFVPADVPRFTQAPPQEQVSRYSDEQLYALARYLYSLQPPPNPNRFDALAETASGYSSESDAARATLRPFTRTTS